MRDADLEKMLTAGLRVLRFRPEIFGTRINEYVIEIFTATGWKDLARFEKKINAVNRFKLELLDDKTVAPFTYQP